MATCFLCFGALMFFNSRRKNRANEIVLGTQSNINKQEMTLIEMFGDGEDDVEKKPKLSDVIMHDAVSQIKRAKRKKTTLSIQSTPEQQYLPITYDGNENENEDDELAKTRQIAAVPEDDELSMSESPNANDGPFGHVPDESSESLAQREMRKRSRGSIVRSELKQLSKHMGDVLHSNR